MRYVDSKSRSLSKRVPEYVCEAEVRLHARDACNAKCFDEIPIHGTPDVQILQTLFEFAEQFLVSASGSTVSPQASFNIALSSSASASKRFSRGVLDLELLKPLGFVALNPAVLSTPSLISRLANLQALQHCSYVLARVQLLRPHPEASQQSAQVYASFASSSESLLPLCEALDSHITWTKKR